jgi:undecaprenyl-diphosphatase
MEYLSAIILGIVEGITEFLPISSTGHLILADHLLGFDQQVGEQFGKAFEVIIQLGAILAIVAAYPRRFLGLFDFREKQGLCGVRGLVLLAITSIPAAILAFLTHHFIKEHLFSPRTVAAALAVGAAAIFAVEYLLPQRERKESVDSITWKEALAIGFFQCFSLWPGMSRSACTILGGMVSGLERKSATEYSFFAAVPIMIAATLFELKNSYRLLTPDHFAVLALGFVVSFVFAWLAVKFLVRFLSRHTLIPFAWYRLGLAVLVVVLLICF